MPEVAEHIWRWFWELSGRRSQGFDSANPLSWLEVKAWRDLMGVMVLPEELAVIFELDRAWLEAVAQFRAETKDSK